MTDVIPAGSEKDDSTQLVDVQTTTCCVVGGGPGGVMLALLLARRGVPVTLLEANPTFERDFRGDTIHPGLLEISTRSAWPTGFMRCRTSRCTGRPFRSATDRN